MVISMSNVEPNVVALNTKSAGGYDSVSQSHLPTELVQEIFSYLSPSDYDSARLVCRTWYEASLYKTLLRNLLFDMKFDQFNIGCPCLEKPFYPSQPSASSCPDTCPCNYQFPEEPISTWDLNHLRMAFAFALGKRPSKVRVACGKLVVDMSPYLHSYNADWGYSGPLREVESLCFSGHSGSFVCTVTKQIGNHGDVERKLWIHRLFTSKHSTFNNFARQTGGFLFFVEGSRCLPGQLYMTMELTKFPSVHVVGLRVEEHLAFSAVRKIVVTYANQKEEDITFNKFKPDQNSPTNSLRDEGTMFYVRKGITYRSSQPSASAKQQNNKGGGRYKPKPKPKSWSSTLFSKKDFLFRKDIVVCTGSPKGTNITGLRTSQRVLSAIGNENVHQMCYRITVPLSLSRGGEYCSMIVTPRNDIFICVSSFPCPTAAKTENVRAQYKLSAPSRASEITPPRITHVTVAPQYFYDFGRGFWWMAVCAAYDNGEIWLWRVDTEVLLQTEDMSGAAVSPTATSILCNEPSLPQVPEKVLNTPSHSPRATSGTQLPRFHRTLQQRPGDFNAELGECVSANLCSFSGENDSPLLEKVNVLLPAPTGEGDDFKYVRAWKLGYMPGLEALNFVGRGKTILAGNKKEIVVWDMRLWNGFERGKLKAEF